jgi:hypothetical protein
MAWSSTRKGSQGASQADFEVGSSLRVREESLATSVCVQGSAAGLAGGSRGASRPAPIEIWSSKIAQLV